MKDKKQILYRIVIIATLYTLCQFSTNITETQEQIQNNKIIYHSINDYDQYLSKFQSMAGQKNTIDVTKYSTSQEICYSRPCKFKLFLYQSQSQQKNLKNILITSGAHGNQKIGPTSLLYLYPLLKGNYRIIYFPIMNPSGYIKNVRQTLPSKIDPNRDYPIDGNSQCYEASSTRIIDYIFRTYRVDLTINLHNGGSQIGWNWGTFNKQRNSHTLQYDIYKNIGDMLYFYAGSNQKLKMKPMKVGTMNEVIYPASGTLDDWAFSASWAVDVPSKCDKYDYQPYPSDMHQGLVFLFQLGRHYAPDSSFGTSQGLNLPVDDSSNNNGYITRTIRMLKQLVNVIDVSVYSQFQKDQNRIRIKIVGCKKIYEGYYTIFQSGSLILQSYTRKQNYKTPDNNSFTYFTDIMLKKPLQNNSQLSFNYQIGCDYDWIDKGATSFSKKRIFRGQIKVLEKNQENSQANFNKIAGKNISEYSYQIYIIPLLSGLFSILLIVTFCQCNNKGKVKNNKKYQVAMHVQNFNSDRNVQTDQDMQIIDQQSSKQTDTNQ